MARASMLAAACALALAVFPGVAPAATQTVSDPAGDVQPCTGECSLYDQDLASVAVDDTGGTITFTVHQYGSFTASNVCHCYFPQVQLYFGSQDPANPDYYIAAYNNGPYPYSMALFNSVISQADPCSAGPGHYGGAYGSGKVADIVPQVIDASTVAYSFPASVLPSSSFRWRVAEPAASRCQTQGNPETSPRDVAPDGALAAFVPGGGTGGGPTGGGGGPTGGGGGTPSSGLVQAGTWTNFPFARVGGYRYVLATFTDGDPGAAPSDFSASVAWGDGKTSGATVTRSGSGFAVIGDHIYKDAGHYPITVTISDGSGHTLVVAAVAEVAPAPLVVAPPRPADLPGRTLTHVPTAGIFSFGGDIPASAYKARIDWGDGSSSTASIGAAPASWTGWDFASYGSHTYQHDGYFKISTTVTRSDGASATVNWGVGMQVTASAARKGRFVPRAPRKLRHPTPRAAVRSAAPAQAITNLRLAATPERVLVRRRQAVRLLVIAPDGTVVRGARVRFAGQTRKTDRRGRVHFAVRLRRAGRYRAKATATGQQPGSLTIRAVRRL